MYLSQTFDGGTFFMPISSTLEKKVDLLLSLYEESNARLKRLEDKVDPHIKVKDKKWISCSELGKRVGLQGRTIQKYINRGLFPTEILKKKATGTTYQWRIQAEKGVELINTGFAEEGDAQ